MLTGAGRGAGSAVERTTRSLGASLGALRALGGRLLARGVATRREGGVERYDPETTPIGSALRRSALIGFVGSVAIVLGATQADSPFTWKKPGAWWFGLPAPNPLPHVGGPGQGLFFGVFAVYGGMLLMLRAWYDIIRLTSRLKGIPVRRLVPVFAAWVAPLLVVAPLFSRDLYSYAAQGELMSHHINPYLYGPGVLSTGTPFDLLTDPLWRNVTSPYGPLFLLLDGWAVSLTGHNALASVEVLRILALLGTVLFAIAVPVIARSFQRDGAAAFTLAALNPLVILHFIGGGHNDALMLGLLLSGYALARRGRPLLGIVLCALAAAVKVPAFIGVVYIGWEWLGSAKTPRERLRPLVTACVVATAVMAAASEVAGIGWRWIAALSNPDTVRSWLDPATGVGLLAGHLLGALGLPGAHVVLTIARGSAFVLAGAICLALLWYSDRVGSLRAIGWSLIAVVVLGPVVQPWYVAWGIVFLAPIAVGPVRKWLCGASAVGCFLGLPGGFVLLNELEHANPALIALFSVLLVGIAVAVFWPRIRRSLAAPPSPAALEPLEVASSEHLVG